jgi:hypothetical protein
MAKTKMTGFARLLIFLIIILPLAFFGASYINGENPLDKLSQFTGGSAGTNEVAQSPSNSNDKDAINDLEKRILTLERDLAVAEEELARCKMEAGN